MKKIICVILCIIFFSLNVYAVGISPSKKIYEFEPGLSEIIEFNVINHGDEVLNIEFQVIGDLEKYFSLENAAMSLEPGETKLFKTELTLPQDLDLAPGDHRNLILASELPKEIEGGTTTIGAIAAVGYVVLVKVPYEGKYLDVLIEVSEAEINHNVYFKIILESLGKQTIENANGNLKIRDEYNETLTTLTFQESNILFKEKREADVVWEEGNDRAGIYNAILDLNYDEKTKHVEKSFRIGELLINILDLNEKEVLKNRVTKLEILTQSMWNKDIISAYAELEVESEKTKSQSVDYEPWEEKNIPIYFDSADFETGTYEAKVTLFYENQTSEKIFNIEIVSPLFSLGNLLIYMIIVVVVLLAVILFVIFKKRKLFKSKNKLK
ncbi:MAG: hypothetical protein ABIJ20_02620 [Nanoarchaeota archaeon]|nr:hypothetical protein [Nanoarchaeota archaeon]MBU1445073.1 hypothetical protein [Nanoarchaeota archaeon]MBU2420739.1 hypothetical protein [Nanoarchaeota archaeon]MBU2475200.1 hypothetical protein [Nanoarchaeota archaeon]